MKTQKRSKHKITQDELNAEQFMNKIPSALLELQKRGFLLPQKEKLEVDELHVSSASVVEETEQEAPFSNQVLNVFERHEQRLANAMTGVYKTSSNSFSSEINQRFEETNLNGDKVEMDLSLDQTSNNWQVPSGIREPQKLLKQLSGNLDGMKGQHTFNFQLPELPNAQKGATKIEIGKLIEQVNIHAQDVSGGSDQMVKVMKEKLIEILKNELNTTF